MQTSKSEKTNSTETDQTVSDPLKIAKLGHGLTVGGDISQYYAKEKVNPLSHAFTSKIVVHPGLGGSYIPDEDMTQCMDDLSHKERSGKSVAYIHVPFCETHCLYCGFYNKPYSKNFSALYTDTLIKEMELWSGRKVYTSAPIHALYLGGGTPTALEAQDLERILNAVKTHLFLANDCEITVEGRLHNFGKEKIEACLKGGANRFSLGVQTFDTEIRQSMGRIADQDTVCKQLELLQSYNQSAVILDLIYGFPKQTMEKWLNDIRIAQSLNLDGVDCYQLNVYDSTPLGKAISAGKIEPTADVPMQSAMFEASIHAMESEFYRRLSMSHWARTSRERNLYNLYTKGVSSGLAFGPGAGGSLHNHFSINQPNVEKWTELVNSGVKPVMKVQKLSDNNKLYKRIAESMEQGWLNFEQIQKEFNIDLESIYAPILSQWQRACLVELGNNKMILTVAGQFWQVNLSQLLLHKLKSHLEI